MKFKKLITTSLATTTLLGVIGLSNFATAASDDVWFDSYDIDVYDEDPFDSVTNVWGVTRGDGDVKSVKVYYEIFRNGKLLTDESNSKNGYKVEIEENHPNSKKLTNWEVKSVHRVNDKNGGYVKEFDDDKLTGPGETLARKDTEATGSKKGDTEHNRSTEYQEQLESIWDEVMKAHDLNKDEWIVCDSSQYQSLKKQPPGSLTSKDVTALFIKSVEYPKKAGDSIPLILVHEKEKKAVLLFQRDKGEKVVVHFEQENNKNNKNNNSSSNDAVNNEDDWIIEKVEEKE